LRRPQFPAHSSWHFADAGTTFNPVAPIDELTNYLSEGAGSASGMLNPNNPLATGATPSANLSNPNMNPTLPGAFNNPSNPKLNADLPGAQTNLANPEFNPSTPGAQNNPSNPSYNTALPGAVNNPSSPSLNPAYPGSLTNPSSPMHNPDLPDPSAIGRRPDDLGPNASFPAQVQSNARTWAPVRSWTPMVAMPREASSYWHVTDDPNFQVNPNQIPFDTNEGKKPGLFVSQDPHYWASMFNSHPEELASNEYENETPRGYLAEMNVQPEGFGNRGYGQEWFIDHPSQDQVKRVWPMQEGLNEYDRQAPDREQEAIQQWQHEQEAMQQWQHTGALDFNPGGHPFRQNKQWMQEWGRGAITPDGEMHTWPESQALHNEMIHQLGFTPYSDDSVTFRISPQGQVRPQDVGPWQNKSDSWIEQQIASRDPRLNSGSVDPEWQRAQGWDPDTGEWIGSHTAADIPGSEMGDANQHADPTEPRPAAPGFPKGCTCDEGLKLECPVHGMHATEQDFDHSWHIPENNPVGYPQGSPRGWATPYQS
jgi:hypothetical protein